MLDSVYNWFCQDNGGLNYCLMCFNRHYDLKDNIIALIVAVGKFNL